MDELTERIEQFLNGELSPEDAQGFAQEMETDENLAKQVLLQRKARELLQANAWVHTKNQVVRLNRKASNSPSTGAWLGLAAAAIAVLVVLGVIMNHQYSDANLYAQYNSLYPDRISVMGENEGDLLQAMILYNERNFKAAAKEFEKIRFRNTESDLTVLYEAISLRESGNLGQSISLLETHTSQGSQLEEAFAWNLILAYLASQQSEKAKLLLVDYQKSGFTYRQSQAKSLQKDLESFWRF